MRSKIIESNFKQSQVNPIRSWLLISLFNLLIAVSIGALLRFAFVEEVSWLVFRNFLHAHSHVAMLGWVYLALYSFFISTFLTTEQQQNPQYKWLFWGTQFTVAGMLISFPIVGYASVSITFSSLHIVASYLFTWRFLKDLRQNYSTSLVSVTFIKTALFFLVLSTMALWAIGPIMVLTGKGSGLYHMAIQFYLHFQINSWFLFGVLGLFFHLLESKNIRIPKNTVRSFYKLLIISSFLTYALAITWANPVDFIFWINSLGVFIQFLAILYFIKIIQQIKAAFLSLFDSWILMLFRVALISFLLKVFIQTAVVIPYIATVAYTVRNFAMGFIHLMLLGMITHFLFAYGSYKNMLELKSGLSKIGIAFFITGFLLSEALLFLQGVMLWQAMGFLPGYYEGLFTVSAFMPLGIALFWIGQLSLKRG